MLRPGCDQIQAENLALVGEGGAEAEGGRHRYHWFPLRHFRSNAFPSDSYILKDLFLYVCVLHKHVC